jgi:hypothetical protein
MVASCVRGIAVPEMACTESLEAAAAVHDILNRCGAEIRDRVLAMLPMPVAKEESQDEGEFPF